MAIPARTVPMKRDALSLAKPAGIRLKKALPSRVLVAKLTMYGNKA